jgi:TorA maturation chaperone TorD
MGIKKGDDFKEPEDHIACLCEIMSGMITGEYGKYFSVSEQRSFFKKHIQPWAEHFFTDLERAKSAIFYSPVGTIGKLFINIEEEAFSMDASR